MRTGSVVSVLLFCLACGGTAYGQYSCKTAPCIVVGQNGWFVGEIKTFAFGEAPSSSVMAELAREGWIECAGQPVSRIQYKQLWNVIGDSWGSSDGKTDLFLPDVRGQFLRGWNHAALSPASLPAQGGDPGATSRQGPKTVAGGGTSGNTGDAVASIEDGLVGSHQHNTAGFGYAMLHQVEFGNGIGGLYNFPNASFQTGDVNGTPSETRPHNIYVMYAIFTGVPSVLDSLGRPTPVALVKQTQPYLGEPKAKK